MKNYKILFFFLGFVLLSFEKEKNSLYSLTIEVEELRNSTGLVQFTLYNKEGSLPDEKFKAYYRMGTSEINNHRATYTFYDLPKGVYAVNILHDENKNGKIDKGILLPIEGVGFSNYNKIGLGNKPKFSKACFNLESNRTIKVKIIYL